MSEQNLEDGLDIELGASTDELFSNVFSAISPETFGEAAAEGDDPACWSEMRRSLSACGPVETL